MRDEVAFVAADARATSTAALLAQCSCIEAFVAECSVLAIVAFGFKVRVVLVSFGHTQRPGLHFESRRVWSDVFHAVVHDSARVGQCDQGRDTGWHEDRRDVRPQRYR